MCKLNKELKTRITISQMLWMRVCSNVIITTTFKTGIDNCRSYSRVTIVKDKDTRQSKGVAFVLFLDRESAHNCARAVNNKQVSLFHIKTIRLLILYVTEQKLHSPSHWCFFNGYSLVRVTDVFVSQLFGRTVKASIAIDNGRATEFIRRRNYTDKSKCYECGVSAYLTFFVLWDCQILLNMIAELPDWHFMTILCGLLHITGYRSSELCMPQKHPGREGTSKEERKEKEEKGSTNWASVSLL